jgi:serine/arginine repetitive matrix protein 2
MVFPLMESPARAPDPEHLKAVWSQSRDKTESNPINSLQAIADDLPAISFSLQEVKSEDGGTPPPSVPSVSSRMSQHEVTKAFQQVPSSSSSSNGVSRTVGITPMSPATTATNTSSSTTTPSMRPQPSYGYPLPHSMSSPIMRPPYAGYPMMSPHHASNPGTVMYPPPMAPSPVPVSGHHGPPPHMNGQAAPMYPGTPMWVPMPPPGAQGPNGLVRPLGSPYPPPPPQMMAYPTPSGQPIYAPMPPLPPQASRAPSQPQQPGVQAPPVLAANGRGRGGILPSPALSHASPAIPMYTASPVLMHSPMMSNAQAAAAAVAAHQYMGGPPPVGGRGMPHLVNSAAAAAAANGPPNAQAQTAFAPGTGYPPRPSW